jgi:hypothetical protein
VKLKKCKLPSSDQIPAELIQTGGGTLLQFTNLLIPFGLRKNCLISGRSLLFYQSTKRVIKLTVQLLCDVTAPQLCTKFYPISFSRLYPYIYEVTGDH